MVTGRRLTTAEDLMNLSADGMRHELIDGELRTMPPAGGEHGDAAGTIHVEGDDVLPGFRMRVGDLLYPFRR